MQAQADKIEKPRKEDTYKDTETIPEICGTH